jgi:hypothetical protein
VIFLQHCLTQHARITCAKRALCCAALLSALYRFTNWTKSECLIEDCTEAATHVDIVVDIAALKALLDSRLPLVFKGMSVQRAALPWPEAL